QRKVVIPSAVWARKDKPQTGAEDPRLEDRREALSCLSPCLSRPAAGSTLERLEMLAQVGMGARDHMDRRNLSNLRGGFGSGFRSSLDRADVAANHHRNQAAADFVTRDDLDIRCLDHGVGGRKRG